MLYEVTNAIYQYEKQALIVDPRPTASWGWLARCRWSSSATPDLHGQTLRFSRRFALPATYDAHYLALADRLEGELWTTDRRLVKAVENDLDWVYLAVGPRTSA